jgi:pimeloyl-ACP methyl ester carboxylesterase
MKRSLFSFINKHGLRVKGLIFEPQGGKIHKTGVVYLPGIVLGMTAVHRLGVDIACELQAVGFPVLLFDHSRIGESEGTLFSGAGEEFANLIKRGDFVDDTGEAVSAFCSERLLNDVILIGHCGGALTAVYTSLSHGRVKKSILISPPLVGEIQEAKAMTKGQSKELAALYKYRLLSWKSWKRLFFGQSDYGQILRMVKTKIVNHRRPKETAEKNQNINEQLIRALELIGRKTDVTIIYGDRDQGIEEFRSYQALFQRWNIRSQIFPETSHGFITADSVRLLMTEILALCAGQ